MEKIKITAASAAASVAAGNYPFPTEKKMRARLQSDQMFRLEATLTMCLLQTPEERAKEDTKERNKRGFMSSDATRGTRLCARICNGLFGADLDDEAKEADDRLGGFLVRALATPPSRGVLSFLSPEDWTLVDSIGAKYAKQMARHATRKILADADPALRAIAATFSVTG